MIGVLRIGVHAAAVPPLPLVQGAVENANKRVEDALRSLLMRVPADSGLT